MKNEIFTLVFVNGPANRHKPPKPQLCRKCNCCCDGSSVANIFWIILWIAFKTAWSFDMDSTLLIFWSSNEWLYCFQAEEKKKQWKFIIKSVHSNHFNYVNNFFSFIGKKQTSCWDEVKDTYITGKTRGKTTEPSAKYWYKTLVSFSLDVYLTRVASTVNTNACVDKSGITSGSSKTFDSFDTDDREPRSYFEIYREIVKNIWFFFISLL